MGSLALMARQMANDAAADHSASHGIFLGQSECVFPDVPIDPPPKVMSLYGL